MITAYDYSTVFQSTKQHANADAMSRVSFEGTYVEPQTTPELVLMVENLQDAPITACQITHCTEGPLLSRVCRYIREGCPEVNNCEVLKPYWSTWQELSIHDGCILWVGKWWFLRGGEISCWQSCRLGTRVCRR